MSLAAYHDFLRSKAAVAKREGVHVEIGAVHPLLKPHQAEIVRWAVSGGRRAIFAAFGLGKTFMQIEALRLVIEPINGRALIVAPLGVRQEFIRDGLKLGQTIRFIRRIEEAAEPGIYITNYETVRDGKLDPRLFDATSLDEASCLRGFGGTKTFREFMALFAGDDRKAGVRTDGIRYRFVAKNEEGYSRARWQIDAHAFARSSGDRLLTAKEIQGLPADQVYRIWRSYNATQLYDFEHHVAIAEALEMKGALPPTFMLLPPHSWHDDVWADVARMLTMNTIQAQQGKEMHLCPLQFDIVDRVIAQASEPGETVFDPFGGLMTVPYRALKLGRKAVGVELNTGYFLDGAKHCEAMAREVAIPSLFDYAGIKEEVAA